MTHVFVSGRGGGKTFRTIEWLIEGHKIDSWPQWSRVIVVPHKQRCVSLVKEHSGGELGQKFFDAAGVGLSKVVLHIEEFRNLRGIDRRQFEVAVDDVDMLIEQALGWRPAWVTYNGENIG